MCVCLIPPRLSFKFDIFDLVYNAVKRLEGLELSRNKIGDEGAIALAFMLSSKCVIVSFEKHSIDCVSFSRTNEPSLFYFRNVNK